MESTDKSEGYCYLMENVINIKYFDFNFNDTLFREENLVLYKDLCVCCQP